MSWRYLLDLFGSTPKKCPACNKKINLKIDYVPRWTAKPGESTQKSKP